MTRTPSIFLYLQLPANNVELPDSIVRRAKRHGLRVEVTNELLPLISENYRENVSVMSHPSADCRMVISLGGDGTFLRAAHLSLKGNEAPVAGINTGTLGFLASWELTDIPRLLTMAQEGRIPTGSRALLSLHCPQVPAIDGALALNDISLLRSQSSQMINVSAALGNSPLTNYTGDGLIICTPTGSTGYNLSAGGPILQPDTNALVLTPIAPHTLTQRPLVISGDDVLSLQVSGRSANFLVSIDGMSRELPCGTRLEISRARRRLSVVSNASEDFAARLRAKLMWGENPVNR